MIVTCNAKWGDRGRLAQYEVKLKKDLGLRKKLSAHDWPAVWDHYREIKEKSGARVAIYLNGTEIPFEKAWKEIKRNCNDRTVRREFPLS